VAYEIYNLENKHQNIGLGMIGELQNPMKEKRFSTLRKRKNAHGGIRHSNFTGNQKKVAV
jgi:hypothetical protein